MPLYKLEDFDPSYRDTFQGDDVIGMAVHAEETNEKIGAIANVLVDEEGHFRYLVIDLGFWIFGKRVLLPIGRSRIDYVNNCVYAVGFSKESAESLPEYQDNITTDNDYEESIRGVYRSFLPIEASPSVPTSSSVQTSTPLESIGRPEPYDYQQEPSLYGMNEQDHRTFRLYEERLVTNKNRIQAGEVAIGKRVEVENQNVVVPIERERVVIERTTPADAGKVIGTGEVAFQEGEVARIAVYEEVPEIRKETYVREEVKIKKDIERETIELDETVRREELEIDAKGLSSRG
jgi:uncharacterized protein (TIGR02271 family)